MKILVICQYYYPEPFRINDICEEMVKRGHEVTVVTGEPNYPEGKIYEGYENHSRTDEIINGVEVHRCPIIPRKTGIVYRFLNYYSYQFKARKYVNNMMASNGKPFDVVFVNQLSPVMMAKPAIHYKKKFGVPVVMYCLDLWPESLIAGGITRKSPIYKFFTLVSKKIYRNMDKVLVTSRMFIDYFENQFGIHNVEYLPQYAEDLFEPLPHKETGETLNLVFAGNIGAVQSVETIIEAAGRLKDSTVHFHIVGSGTDLEKIQKMAEGLKNVSFYGRRPLEEMPEFYAKADAMLVTLQADPIISLTLPGKVQSYMAVGKPIIGAINGETAKTIEAAQCGFCGPAEDADELVANIRKFMVFRDKSLLEENAIKYYSTFFSRDKFMNRLENCLKDYAMDIRFFKNSDYKSKSIFENHSKLI